MTRLRPMPLKCAGMTLLETLIALLIFSLLSLMMYRSITLLSHGVQRTAAANEQLQAIARLQNQLANDCLQVQTLPARFANGQWWSAVYLNNSNREDPLALDAEPTLLAINTLKNTRLVHHRYRLLNNTLILEEWLGVDNLNANPERTLTMLEHVKSIRWAAYDASTPYVNNSDLPTAQWTLGNRLNVESGEPSAEQRTALQQSTIPRVLELQVETMQGEISTWRFSLPNVSLPL